MTIDERVFGRSGIRVSDACLGTMTFGTSWGFGAEEPVCAEIYRAFREAGGNFLDTANNYTDGEAETITGRLIAAERDAVVLSTKFTLPGGTDVNSSGSHRKSLRQSVETSLRRLGTDYIDVLLVHAWDQKTPLDETLRALDDLVRAGKVLTIGVSNTPAWVISRGDLLAELRGWTPFAGVQLEYSLVARTADRDLLPMAKQLGLHVSAWSPLARGLLAGKPQPHRETPQSQKIVEELAKVAADVGSTPARVALAWVVRHGLTPVIGARSLEQVTDNLAAFETPLDDELVTRLDEVSAVSLGYPHEFLRDMFPQLAAG